MNAIPAQPVTVNVVYSNPMIYELKRQSLFSNSPAYLRQTVFCTTINEYIRILYYFPSEATRLKTSIILIAGTMDTRAPFIVLKTCMHLWSRDTNSWRMMYKLCKENASLSM